MELKDLIELSLSAGKNPVVGGLAVALVVMFLWWNGRKQARAIRTLQNQVAEFEGLLRGVAFYQCDPMTDRIMTVTPQLAAMLGIAVTDIIDKPFHKVFEAGVVGVIHDMTDRLSRHEEVVNTNVNVNGAVCTVAMRKVFTRTTYTYFTHIHRQDGIV